ncbi:MAG TPA: hypothetical protein PLR25_11370 [Planctomycetaceae bacterium]|nr:hypothetical protein [Planctomycetaceae bacterium]
MSKLRFYAAALTIGALTGLSSAQADDTTAEAGQQANRSQNDQADRSDAQPNPQHVDAQQRGPTVREALVRKLIKANDAEIEIAKLAQKKTDNALKMTKDMLNKYERQDFNMAFLGQQCMAHTMMLAELKAIESVGPEELRPIAQEAASKVEQHLEKVEQLAQKHEDDRKPGK